jgi:orotate phosphoribosyltransferase
MNLIHELIKIGAIKSGKFKLSSGIESNYYVDIKLALLTNETSLFISNHICNMIARDSIIAGYGLGGSLLVACVISRSNLSGLVIRDKKREHGTERFVEGPLCNKKIVLLEDVITTGKSVLTAMERLTVAEIITVVNRSKMQEIAGIPIKSLINEREICSALPNLVT